MALNLQLVALSLPAGTEFPGTMQELEDLVAQYLTITGDENFSGINYGNVEPTADNRDKPWFKLDGSNLPIGWFVWTGVAWTSIPQAMPSGTTANRPSSPQNYQQYYDTDLKVALIYSPTAGKWVTVAGSPGDIKEVKSATLAAALVSNPGWSWDSASSGLVVGGASSGSASTDHAYGATVGAESVLLVQANLSADTVKFPDTVGYFPGAFQNGSQAPGIAPLVKGLSSAATLSTQSLNGGVTQVPVSVLQPTIYYWRLVKDLT